MQEHLFNPEYKAVEPITEGDLALPYGTLQGRAIEPLKQAENGLDSLFDGNHLDDGGTVLIDAKKYLIKRYIRNILNSGKLIT